METVFFLLPAALIMSIVALTGFFWAVKNGQFDDLEGPRWRVLFDDDVVPPEDPL